MQQTLLALCAVLVFSLYALNRHRADAHHERDAVGGEVELAAAERARALLARASALPYDEADVPDGADAARVRTDTAGLARTLGPEHGETNPGAYDDVDDWHGHAGTERATWGSSNAVAFRSAVRVRYVRPLDPADTSAVPTLAKEVIVTLREQAPTAGRPPAIAELRQVVTPAWASRHR